MKHKKLAIFDLDGTLLDTAADLGNATNYALRTLGYPEHPIDDYHFLVGRGIMNLFKKALPAEASTEENAQKMRSLFLPYYDEHKCDFTRPYPGIEDMLSALYEQGCLLAVASNKYQDGAEKLVSHFFSNVQFACVMGQQEGFPIKPDPEIVNYILSKCPEVNKEDVAYIGDSNVDMQTGINAGVKTIGVEWGFRSREELEAYNPWKIVSKVSDLKEILLKL